MTFEQKRLKIILGLYIPDRVNQMFWYVCMPVPHQAFLADYSQNQHRQDVATFWQAEPEYFQSSPPVTVGLTLT